MLGADYDYVIWVAGDDASVWFDEVHSEDVLDRMYSRVYTRDPFGTEALG